ncbi:signal peptidase I, partial [Candidatus Azambacteria bacterium]|nr:signal peptidase I [Candidatus Azambacteria bacterium]
IVFRYPYNPKQYYIKRIVGLPGEIISIHDKGITIKNKENPDGFPLKESYIPEPDTYGNTTVTLGPDEYFVLGDNREASSDSRRWGPLKKEFITGKVWIRAFPFEKAETF